MTQNKIQWREKVLFPQPSAISALRHPRWGSKPHVTWTQVTGCSPNSRIEWGLGEEVTHETHPCSPAGLRREGQTPLRASDEMSRELRSKSKAPIKAPSSVINAAEARAQRSKLSASPCRILCSENPRAGRTQRKHIKATQSPAQCHLPFSRAACSIRETKGILLSSGEGGPLGSVPYCRHTRGCCFPGSQPFHMDREVLFTSAKSRGRSSHGEEMGSCM